MNDPKTTPTFPASSSVSHVNSGLSQYAYVAAQLHAHLISSNRYDGRTPKSIWTQEAFDNTDAFFAELAKRTK